MAPTLQDVGSLPEKLLLATPRGYCAGVDRAVQTVERALDLYGPPIYVRKEIVHNKHVVDQLRERGAIFVDSETEVPEGSTVVFSAHGIAPSVRRGASKRGGEEDVTIVTFDESMLPVETCGQELLALDAALGKLAQMEPRQAMMVESRFFGGLDITETATLLGVSEATILRDWRAAKAWLAQALRPARQK